MDIDRYQILAGKTADPRELHIDGKWAIAALGLAGEAGEVVELIKKYLGHGHGLDRDKLVKELGDALWYIARLSSLAGVPLSTVADKNIEKLAARFGDKFSEEASRARVDLRVTNSMSADEQCQPGCARCAAGDE